MRTLTRLVALLATLGLVMGMPATVLAAPDNDDISTPRLVGALPYADGPYDTTEATTGATDPPFCYDPEGGPDWATVWYSFTPSADGALVADTFGSDYDTTLYVGTPALGGGIDVIDCNDDAQDLQSAVFWDATAGTTYLIAVGTCCGGGVVGEAGGGGMLTLHVDVAPPAPTLDLWVAPIGQFSRYGVATIRGTLACENAWQPFIELSASQRVGRFVLRGWGWTEGPTCDGTAQPWEAQVTSDDGKLLGGFVEVNAWAEACNPVQCANDWETARVRLGH